LEFRVPGLGATKEPENRKEEERTKGKGKNRKIKKEIKKKEFRWT